MTYPRWSRCVLVTGLILLAGCGGDGPLGGSNRLGEYALSSFNGQSLPATVNIVLSPEQVVTEVNSGSLVLARESEATASLVIRMRSGGQVYPDTPVDFGAGTHAMAGDDLVLSFPTIPEPFPASLGGAGGALIISADFGPPWGVLVFRRTSR